MALNSHALDLVIKVAERAGRPCRLVCLGYPDMLVAPPVLEKLLGDRMAKVSYRDDSGEILNWHRIPGQLERIAETRSVFAAIGVECEFLDVNASRGFEIVCDLNEPLAPGLRGRFDVLYDGGTLEHCFNFGQVMRNILALVRTGGFIVHVNPFNVFNHGFFNFNPTLYHDWYTQAGHTIVTPIYAMNGHVLAPQLTPLPATDRILQAPANATILLAAQKANDAEPAWPVQTKYRNHSQLKA